MKVYLPWLGEFGNELLRWVPAIYNDPGDKIVCYEAGKECLYPRGTEFYVIPRIEVTQRVCSGSLNQVELWAEIRARLGPDHEYIEPHSTWPMAAITDEFFVPETRDFGFECDVAIFPRFKKQGPFKNWDYWQYVVDELTTRGVSVFACGHKDSSSPVSCPTAWDYEDSLEASVWGIIHSKVRIGPSTALTILSHYCNKSVWVLCLGEGPPAAVERTLPNFRYAKYADKNQVGIRIVPYMSEPEKVVEEICTSIGL